jgi:hypothetical protein
VSPFPSLIVLHPEAQGFSSRGEACGDVLSSKGVVTRQVHRLPSVRSQFSVRPTMHMVNKVDPINVAASQVIVVMTRYVAELLGIPERAGTRAHGSA